MKLLFLGLFTCSVLIVYFFSSSQDEQENQKISTPITSEKAAEMSSPDALSTEINSSSNDVSTSQNKSNEQAVERQTLGIQIQNDSDSVGREFDPLREIEPPTTDETLQTPLTELDDASSDTLVDDEEEPEQKLPGEEVNFKLKLHTSTHHLIDGRADSDIGKMLFKSRLMPSYEVKLSIKLKQGELDDIDLIAYVDLANFTMELDGSNGVLNKDHKQVFKYAIAHLGSQFEAQYQGYDAPEHALVLVRMISYWSASPKGYVHEKRSISSQ